MSRAMQVLVGEETIDWITADNKVVNITQTELGKALKLAGQEQSRLWVKGE